MITDQLTVPPKFNKYQVVRFVGGVGKILYFQPDSHTWKYAVEMAKGPEPDMGRIGPETTILLHEEDIDGTLN
ncbi:MULTISPECIES: hypothetical protein [Nostocales]|uniref:Uncharacterized protein n=3 Tax=Nostocales TaxID=1161 RepID=A0A0C1NA07_9CYAN|nr:hypothetical protein [Tolypothrix bouteillei]KAF3886845.1 hypothetical protein DA73_0400016145 [Tolypothrix bouteillei VB521301]